VQPLPKDSGKDSQAVEIGEIKGKSANNKNGMKLVKRPGKDIETAEQRHRLTDQETSLRGAM
jgi:hypothetical protein